MSTEQQRAAQLEAADDGVLKALEAAGIGEDPNALATAMGVVLGSLAGATDQGERFIEAVVTVARAALRGELDG